MKIRFIEHIYLILNYLYFSLIHIMIFYICYLFGILGDFIVDLI